MFGFNWKFWLYCWLLVGYISGSFWLLRSDWRYDNEYFPLLFWTTLMGFLTPIAILILKIIYFLDDSEYFQKRANRKLVAKVISNSQKKFMEKQHYKYQ